MVNTSKGISANSNKEKIADTNDLFLESDKTAVSMGAFSIALLIVLILILSVFN